MLSVGPHQTTPTLFADAVGKTFSYRKFGTEAGTPLLFLQHFTGTMDNWDPILTNTLAQTRPIILFDNAGVGRSTGATPPTMGEMADDAIAFVKALGIDEIDLFGFSLGGFISQEILLRAPELIRRAVLLGTGPTGGEGMAEFSPKVVSIVTRPNSTFEERCLELFFSPTETSQAAGKAWLERVASRTSDREPACGPEVAQAQLAAIQGFGRGNGDRPGTLAKIKQPVLVINGHDDIMVPTINSFILQQELPNAKLIVYPDSGHAAQFQFPDEIAFQTEHFLA